VDSYKAKNKKQNDKMILFLFYPTSPATTVQEIAQWRNLYLVIIYKVSSLKLCIFDFSALSVSYISFMAV